MSVTFTRSVYLESELMILQLQHSLYIIKCTSCVTNGKLNNRFMLHVKMLNVKILLCVIANNSLQGQFQHSLHSYECIIYRTQIRMLACSLTTHFLTLSGLELGQWLEFQHSTLYMILLDTQAASLQPQGNWAPPARQLGLEVGLVGQGVGAWTSADTHVTSFQPQCNWADSSQGWMVGQQLVGQDQPVRESVHDIKYMLQYYFIYRIARNFRGTYISCIGL